MIKKVMRVYAFVLASEPQLSIHVQNQEAITCLGVDMAPSSNGVSNIIRNFSSAVTFSSVLLGHRLNQCLIVTCNITFPSMLRSPKWPLQNFWLNVASIFWHLLTVYFSSIHKGIKPITFIVLGHLSLTIRHLAVLFSQPRRPIHCVAKSDRAT